MTLFERDDDYAAFERVLEETYERTEMRLLNYCVMPHHAPLFWPRKDGELSETMRWLTVTHTQRWHAHYHSSVLPSRDQRQTAWARLGTPCPPAWGI